MHLTDAPVESPEWFEVRRTRINGSEIAAVLGLSPFESPFSLWHRKAGTVGDVECTPVMYWGTRLESVIRDEWNLRHPDLTVAKVGQWCHVARPWQGGGPDGLGDGRLWEGKTARYGDEWGEEGSDEIPVYYRAQTLWYLDVFGFDVCDVSVLIGGSDYREYRVRHNADEAAFMRARAQEFLGSVATNTPPGLDGHEATYQVLRQLHPDIDDASVDLPAEVAEPYLGALAGYEEAVAEKRRCSSLVIQAMGSAKTAYYNGHKIAGRQAKGLDGAPYLVAARGASAFHNQEWGAA
jgi:putative phage-type endonuclease